MRIKKILIGINVSNKFMKTSTGKLEICKGIPQSNVMEPLLYCAYISDSIVKTAKMSRIILSYSNSWI